MLDLTAEQFAQRALHLNLIDQQHLHAVWSECGTRNIPAVEFQNILVRRELLTNYQIERLLKGEKTGFFYGDYKVLYLVGTGSFARVYRAVHKDTGQIVAIKVLRKRYADSPVETEKFVREGELGATLRHPNIVPILGVHCVRKTYFLVLAFVEGQSLREFVRLRKKVEPLEATEIMAGVISGLSYAAEKGITHRDLKLSNVLISSDGRPQLVDFGLAAVSAATGEGGYTNTRTIDYAALEKLTGVRKDDSRSDIYFAGCIYYHLLSGVPPLSETRDKFQRMNMARFREVKPIRSLLPDVAVQVEHIVMRAMELDVSKRYARPLEMLIDVQKAIKALAEEAHKPASALAPASVAADAPSVMLVESNPTIQNALRTGLKNQGYRVLVIGDPVRAQERLFKDQHAARCVLISAASLGKAALGLLANLRKQRTTADLPVLLMFGKSQKQAQQQMPLDAHTVSLSMPLRMSEVCERLGAVLNNGPPAAGDETLDACPKSMKHKPEA
jgi:serine/threonine-protein kinase